MNQMRAVGRSLAVTAAILALALPARGQSSCAEGSVARGGAPDTAAALVRPITLRARNLTLRAALERVAAEGHLRLSYSAELLPVERAACAAFEDYPVGDALRALLRGLPVRVVAAGGDQVVLAPGTVAAAAEPSIPLVTIERIVVKGTPAAANERSKTLSTDIVDGRRLDGQGADNLAQALNANIPGVWLWAQSPSSLLAQYGSIRGASSFGVSAPKMYIDGIEVANPLLLTHIDPSAIERVEVIRGPQGGALYGANSISGVTNIVTRYENPDEGAPRLRLQTGLGRAGSDYGRAALAQDYRAAFRTGSPARSAGANLSLSSLGAFIPGAYGRSLGLTAGARNVGSRSLVSGTFRLYAQSTGTPLSPLLAGIHPTTTSSSGAVGSSGTELTPSSATATTSPSSGESVVEYTFGLNASTAAGKHWTHSAVAGVDGYRLHGVPEETQPFLSAADSALRAAQGGADRATLRLSTVGRYDLGQKTNLAVTFTAEQSLLRQQMAPDAVVSSPSPLQTGGWTAPATTHSTEAGAAPTTTHSLEAGPAASTTWAFQPRASSANVQATASTVEIWRNNTGVAAQLDGSYADRFFLTGGLRLERDEDLVGNVHDAALPMLGVAWATDMGPVTLKLRSSYGKGIRLPQASLRELLWATSTARADGANLGPEQQSGIETGFDLFAGRALTLKVTRFDQVASGLVQRVMVDAENNAWGAHGLRYQLQNIGRIGNHGWEMQATTRLGALSATGAFTFVDSRVERVANGYTGELRPGDRALEVPAKTASITGTWAPPHGLFSLTAYRALDWVNYDRLSLAQALVDGRLRRPFLGSDLRNYWLVYPGVTHLRASMSRDLRHGVTLLLTGDNLLDHQRGEPDNITVTPGRTFSFGIRADF